MRISTGYGSRPVSGGFETFTWYFMRISAIGLVFLAIIHLVLNHVTTDVACTSYQLVALRYENPFWRLYDWLLLTLALLHGMNGLRVVIYDYVRTRSCPLALLSTISVLVLIFFMLGTII